MDRASRPLTNPALDSLIDAVDDQARTEKAAVAAVALVGERVTAGAAGDHVEQVEHRTFPPRGAAGSPVSCLLHIAPPRRR